MPATVTGGGCLAASTDANYGQYFGRIYKPGWSNVSVGLYVAPGSDVYAEPTGFLQTIPNDIGVWVDSDCTGTKDALAPGVQTTISYNYTNTGAIRTIYIGVFGDNHFQVKCNNDLIECLDIFQMVLTFV